MVSVSGNIEFVKWSDANRKTYGTIEYEWFTITTERAHDASTKITMPGDPKYEERNGTNVGFKVDPINGWSKWKHETTFANGMWNTAINPGGFGTHYLFAKVTLKDKAPASIVHALDLAGGRVGITEAQGWEDRSKSHWSGVSGSKERTVVNEYVSEYLDKKNAELGGIQVIDTFYVMKFAQ